MGSDRELTTVLKVHKGKLDPELVIDEPVKMLTSKLGIVDLMLSRSQKRHRADDYEHVVVELKAPKVKLTSKELTQMRDYAQRRHEAAQASDDPGQLREGALVQHL